jgi:hypothetical protein
VIDLRALVALPGLAPVTARLHAGEVVRIEGDASAVAALLDVIAGRRRAHAGEVVRDAAAATCLVRRGEELPPGVDAAAAIELWSSFAAEPAARRGVRDGTRAAARGHAVARTIWLADRGLDDASERAVQAAADEVRAGPGLMIWADAPGRERSDRVLVLAAAPASGDAASARSAPRSPLRRAAVPPVRRLDSWRAVIRFAAAAALSRSALVMGAVAALWIAACAVTLAAHEDFWFAAGSAAALAQLATLSCGGTAIACATATAARYGAAPAWPAMLRETGVSLTLRSAALVGADVGGAAIAALVAALPAVWMVYGTATGADATASVVATLGTIAASAAAAGGVARVAAPGIGALVGAGLAIALQW